MKLLDRDDVVECLSRYMKIICKPQDGETSNLV